MSSEFVLQTPREMRSAVSAPASTDHLTGAYRHPRPRHHLLCVASIIIRTVVNIIHQPVETRATSRGVLGAVSGTASTEHPHIMLSSSHPTASPCPVVS